MVVGSWVKALKVCWQQEVDLISCCFVEADVFTCLLDVMERSGFSNIHKAREYSQK